MPLNSTLKVATLPLNIKWNDCEHNLMEVASRLHTLAPDTDILVLPEMFTSGFVKTPELLDAVSKYADATLATIKGWSERHNVAIAGSFQVKEDGKTYNRAFFVEPSGETTIYNKRHLFCLSPESQLCAQGTQLPPVIRFRGWNISMIVCYDLRFPVWCRNDQQRYDILLVPANWPSSREYAWKHLLIARAIENQAIVVGANRSGEDEYGNYNNTSFIMDYAGHIVAPKETPNDASEFIYATFTKEELTKWRSKIPVFNDADNFTVDI